jgi:phage terminase small subunit
MTKAPSHLSPAAKDFWNTTAENHDLDHNELIILTMAAEAIDHADAARKIVARDGLIITGPRGSKQVHPAARLARQEDAAFLKLVRQLKLNDQRVGTSPTSFELYKRRHRG